VKNMRWGLGFFRVWLVLLSVYIEEPATYRLSWLWREPRLITVSKATKAREEFDLSRTREQLSDDVTEAVKREIELLKISDKSAADQTLQTFLAHRDELLATVTTGYEEAKQKARIAWLITLVPPVGMLFLASVLPGYCVDFAQPLRADPSCPR
jgi:hypothetical protein